MTDPKLVVTRYMPLRYALDFIVNRRMYLARFDSWEDRFEGYALDQLMADFDPVEFDSSDFNTGGPGSLNPSIRQRRLYGSCWFGGDETLAMWERTRSEPTLAIQTNYSIARTLFTSNNPMDPDIRPNYPIVEKKFEGELENAHFAIDFARADFVEYVGSSKPIQRRRIGFYKLDPFKHEKEFRFVVRQSTGPLGEQEFKFAAQSYVWELPKSFEFSIVLSPYLSKLESDMIRGFIRESEQNLTVIDSKYTSIFHH